MGDIDKKLEDVNISWDKKDEDDLSKNFNLSMDEEVSKLLNDIKEKDKDKPKILENIPREFIDGDKKILLEG
jgi:hypothetical protein